MTSVERLLVFNSIQSEAQGQEKNDPPSGQWPTEGAITFRGVSLCYRPGLPRVLNGVNLAIPGGIKVGVCGRTGAGKSSLMLALFRIVESEAGSVIEIDGVNILNMSLRTLRTQLTIIPQDPVMFSGTLRSLSLLLSSPTSPPPDTTSTPSGATLTRRSGKPWSESTSRKTSSPSSLCSFLMKSLSEERTSPWDSDSSSASLVRCFANPKSSSWMRFPPPSLPPLISPLPLPQATASVDSLTDKKIQSTIRSEFHHCTILTIAHRLETIADYDRIVVMSAGQVAEYGPLHELLALPSGQFKSLVDELGPEVKAQFLETARNRYDLNDLS
jgi:ATP-binding cassette, subfamily C (CFTR/MRP), member 1